MSTGAPTGAVRTGAVDTPGQNRAAGGGAPPAAPTVDDVDRVDHVDYVGLQQSPEFQGLRRALRTFVFPAAALFLAWYVLFVLMTVYARGFMRSKVLGEINVAYVFGLLQFASTFVIAYVYSRYAARHLDPTARAVAALAGRAA